MPFTPFLAAASGKANANPASPPGPPAVPAGSRSTTPGTQPMAGPPMPQRPQLQAPKSNKPHPRSTSLAKHKTTKGKHVIPPVVFK
jgi:hypothetical protein